MKHLGYQINNKLCLWKWRVIFTVKEIEYTYYVYNGRENKCKMKQFVVPTLCGFLDHHMQLYIVFNCCYSEQ